LKILIDIGHPAHVHYYRNLANELEKKGHQVYWTVKDIDIAKHLLTYYGFKYYVLPKKSDSLPGKIWKQFLYDFIILKICLQKRIDIAIGTSVSVAHVSKISGVKSVVFDDDDDSVQPLVAKYVNPFADSLLAPEALKGRKNRKDTIYYNGTHELCYLHPKYFTPYPSVLKEIGLSEKDTFFIMRFNVFKAHHDIGAKGLSLNRKLQLIELLKPYGKVFITTEREIEPELKEYRLSISPEKIHSLMAFSTMFLGDSQTMTSEAAVLGIPTLKCNTFAGKLSVPNELEDKYQLCFSYQPADFDKMTEKINELLSVANLKEEFQRRRQKMLADKINVTAFMVWFIENYPQSMKIMKENPDYQYNFK
jgi:hypothetical protein